MRQSHLFTKTSKQPPADSTSRNHRLLVQAGFIDQLTAGVYSLLPLGLSVINRISAIIREELTTIGAQEVLMPALHPKANWVTTGRWDKMDVLFKTTSQTGQEYGLGPTHEEIVVPLVKKSVTSYKDLPLAVFQIQSKFRDELRPKSGILRGREFLMKDMYSFHTTPEDLDVYYATVSRCYQTIFTRCGVPAIVTEAPGGSFTTKLTHEFQIPTPAGEDTIIWCQACGFARNTDLPDVAQPGTQCPRCSGGTLTSTKAIEVGNIFDLGQRFAKDFAMTFQDAHGQSQLPYSGCYGIGVSRLLGAIAEATSDEHGLAWPAAVAPFQVHVLPLGKTAPAATAQIVADLEKAGSSVLLDDRDVRAGEKFNDADLLGMPHRVVISEKTPPGKVEYKSRTAADSQVISLAQLLDRLQAAGV